MIKDENTPTILESNIFYLLIGLLLLTLGTIAQIKSLYIGLLITEYIIVLLPVILYLKLKGYSLKTNLRLNPISFKQILISILIVIFSYPVAVFFNFIGMTILNLIGDINATTVPMPSTGGQYIVSFIIIAISPGICEEVMFRGMIMSSYNRLGKKKAIIYSAIAFGFFHFNGANLLGPIYLGVLFGMMVYKTNSLYSSIIGHTVNNGIALTIGYFLNRILDSLNELGGEVTTSVGVVPGTVEIIISILVLGFIALVCGAITYKLFKILPETKERDKEVIDEKIEMGKMTGVEVIPLIIIFAIFIFWNKTFLFL